VPQWRDFLEEAPSALCRWVGRAALRGGTAEYEKRGYSHCGSREHGKDAWGRRAAKAGNSKSLPEGSDTKDNENRCEN